MSLLEGVRILARKASESLYEDHCDILEYREEIDEATGLEDRTPIILYKKVPCRISYQSIPAAAQTEGGAALTQGIKLFLSSDIVVKPGSLIKVTRNGILTDYQCSGEPARYLTHQEIELTLKEAWT